MQARGGTREVQFFGHRHEIPQMPEFHATQAKRPREEWQWRRGVSAALGSCRESPCVLPSVTESLSPA
jgi:hypothetical protein